MTEARIEEIVEEWDREAIRHEQMERLLDGMDPGALRALIADWRAKKAEIGRLKSTPLCNGIDVTETAYKMGYKDGAEATRAKCEAIARPWLSTGTLKLRAGEMTAQEVRSVKAVVGSIVRAIAELKQS